MANSTRKVSLLFLIYFILNFNDVILQDNRIVEEYKLDTEYPSGRIFINL